MPHHFWNPGPLKPMIFNSAAEVLATTFPQFPKARRIVFDYETFGLHTGMTSPAEFAAAITDEHYNVQAYLSWRIKLRFGVIASPAASMITGFAPGDYLQGESEYSAALAIHKLFNLPHLTSVGFNSRAFDDILNRFLFWRNLLPAYDHERGPGPRRLDAYRILRHFWALRRDNINLVWPQTDKGVSFKLEHLNKANNFALGQAHQALSDVRATIGLLQHLQQQDREFFAQTELLFDRTRAQNAKTKTYQKVSNPDPYHALYDTPFPTTPERKLFTAFHQAAPEDKMAVANRFPNPTHRKLALRIMRNEYALYLSSAEYAEAEQEMERIYDNAHRGTLDHTGKFVCQRADAERELVKLRQQAFTGDKQRLFRDICSYHSEINNHYDRTRGNSAAEEPEGKARCKRPRK